MRCRIRASEATLQPVARRLAVRESLKPTPATNAIRPGNRVSGPNSFLIRDAQDACEVAVDVDAKVFSAFFGREHDLVDQRPQMLRGFAAPVLPAQRIPEILDLAAVTLRHGRVQQRLGSSNVIARRIGSNFSRRAVIRSRSSLTSRASIPSRIALRTFSRSFSSRVLRDDAVPAVPACSTRYGRSAA